VVVVVVVVVVLMREKALVVGGLWFHSPPPPPPPPPTFLLCRLLISEVFPLEVRGQAVALSVQTNFFFNMAVAWIFPEMQSYLGSSTTFGIFAVIAVMALLFVVVVVPETKGLTLEQIEVLFERRRPSPSVQTSTDHEDSLHEHLLSSEA